MSTLWQGLEAALTESQSLQYLQPARKEKHTYSEGSGFRENSQNLFSVHRETTNCVCVYFQTPRGLPLKDGITNEGRAVSTVLPADSCWEYRLYYIMSVEETVLKYETDKLCPCTVYRP